MENKDVLYELYEVIIDRKNNPKEGSYTNYLFENGLDKILKKVGEETAETIIAAKNEQKDQVIYELSDLLYHISVLLAEREITWDDVLINDAQNARFHISDFYRKMGNTVEDKEAAEYIREKIKQAEWLQQCLEQRKTTLLNLAEKIVERQQGFFSEWEGISGASDSERDC